MPQYIVKKPCRVGGQYKAPDTEVSLTEMQAKYLLLSGHLELKTMAKTSAKAKKESAE